MKPRTLLITLLALGIIAWLAVTLSNRNLTPPASIVGQALLSNQTLVATNTIEIKDSTEPQPLILQLDTQANLWRINSYHNAPANLTRIAKLTDDLQGSKIQREVTSNPDRFPRLGLGERTITFRDDQNKTIYNLQLGKTSEGGGLFAKRENDSAAVEIHPQIFFSARPDEWLARDLFQFKPEDITALTVELPDGSKSIYQRGPEKQWQLVEPTPPEGKTINTEIPQRILQLLLTTSFFQHHIRGDTEAIPAYENSREITFSLSDGETFSLRIGRRPATIPPQVSETSDQTNEQNTTAAPAGPVLIFLESAPEKFVWSEAAKTILPVSTETLWNALPQTEQALFTDAHIQDQPQQTSEETLLSAPLITPE